MTPPLPRLPVRFATPLVVALLVAACASSGGSPAPTPAVEARGLQVARLNRAMQQVAIAQAPVDPPLADALDALREIDASLAALRDPERLDEPESSAAWTAAAGGLDGIDVAPARAATRKLAARVDEARLSLARARSVLDDPWELRYLDAEDAVLSSVREYAAASDALAQVLQLHLETYRDVAAVATAFLERRSFYRSAEEAVAALEVDLSRYLDDLEAARRQIPSYSSDRDDAAAAVNAASEHAATVWRERPADQPTAGSPAPTGGRP